MELVLDGGRRGVKATFTDAGPGIPAAERDRVFERFYRVEGDSTRGTGLGLSIAKAIVDAHGGTITVESAKGVGTTFRVVLPLVPTPHVALVA